MESDIRVASYPRGVSRIASRLVNQTLRIQVLQRWLIVGHN